MSIKRKKIIELFEKYKFSMNKYDGIYSLETWTKGGVNMIVELNKFELSEFKNYVDGFEVDEEVDRHREWQDYRKAFTIRQSLEDFEGFEKTLNKIVEEWGKL